MRSRLRPSGRGRCSLRATGPGPKGSEPIVHDERVETPSTEPVKEVHAVSPGALFVVACCLHV